VVISFKYLKRMFLIGVLLLKYSFSFGQNKPTIDEQAIQSWPELSSNALISSTGKYVCYSISNGKSLTILLQDVSSKDKKIVKASEACFFVGDTYLVFKRLDSLFSLALPKYDVKFLALVTGPVELNKGNIYSIKFQEKSDTEKRKTVILNPKNGLRKTFFTIEEENEKAFLKTDSQGINSVWVKKKNGKIMSIGDDKKLQTEQKLKIYSVDNLSRSGVVKVTLTEMPAELGEKELQAQAKLTLWNFKDWQIQYRDEFKPSIDKLNYSAFILPVKKEIVQFENQQHQALKIGKYAWLVSKRVDPLLRFVYGPKGRSRTKFDFLISETDGRAMSLSKLDSTSQKSDNIYATDDSRFIVYFNTEIGDYYSYDVIGKKTINLTSSTNSFRKASSNEFFLAGEPYSIFESSTTFQVLSDGFLVVNDGFDFWKLDPSGKIQPICLTNHFGRKNNINFQEIPDFSFTTKSSSTGRAIVAAVNSITKRNGFFEIHLDEPSTPKSIVFQDASIIRDDFNGSFRRPIKAMDANVWLFQKSSAEQSPNWYITDGRQVQVISDLWPEKGYNWLTSELLSWKTQSGAEVQGILYKPEDMDPSKKYPVIITYYENRSNGIYDFLKPELMHTMDINIPKMVSRGYMVFVPDMKYRVGDVLKSALECLESGVDEICKRKYVDRDRIGLSGHSHGGYETAYFVTQSKRFKAASIGAPITNLISWYNDWSPKNNQVRDQGNPQGVIEWRQTRMVKSMMERPDWYIQNSPIFYVDKVTTPVLIMHNREDGNVPFSQGAEFFLALSRLGQPAWLLQYDKERHSIGNAKNKMDLTIRTEQFFDHYLKGAPLPVWMIDGIPYKEKNYKTGLELDTVRTQLGISPFINQQEQKLIDQYSKIPLSEKLNRIKD